MKKRLLTLVMSLIIVLSCVGCGEKNKTVVDEKAENKDFYAGGYFTTIDKWSDSKTYRIVYANDTNVKYLIVAAGYQFGITPLYNADGTIQVYDKESTVLGETEETNSTDSYFTTIEKWSDSKTYRIVYANDTKVKYLIAAAGYQYGITPLYNEDGTLQLYDGD